MKEDIVERLQTELGAYENQYITRQFMSKQMLDKAYEIVMKRELVEVVERWIEEDGISDCLWEYLKEQEDILEYLYQIWMGCDYSFVAELTELMKNEMEYQLTKS